MLIKNLLYILQCEDYDLIRFWRFVYAHPRWWALEKRQKLTWTAKIYLLYASTLAMVVGLIATSLWILGFVAAIITFIITIVLLPFLTGFSFILTQPLDFLLKKRLIEKAKNILKQNKIIIIGITGSYGKTSTKEILNAILEKKYSVIKTPENVNTVIGIAEFIIKNQTNISEKNILIVEIGAYKIGDIAAVCDIIQPSYSILTGINSAHMERFGSMENTISAKFELPERTNGLSVLNFDDENIKNNYQKFLIKQPQGVTAQEIKNIEWKENFTGFKFEFADTEFETGLLAEHNTILFSLCFAIAKELGLSLAEIKDALKNLKPIKHRLEPIYNTHTGIMVIDDSYNGNLNGIISGINVLNRAKGRKIVLTPGLVELGKNSKIIHHQIGELYAKNKVDLVLLIKNKQTSEIIKGLQQYKFNDYKIYNDTQEAHDDLKNILKKGDTIIFQNDLPDIYS